MKHISLLAGLVFSPSTIAFAQDQLEAPVQAAAPDAAAAPRATAAGDSTDAERDAIVVTATRSPVSIDRVTASVTVLDKAAIDRAGDLSVADLLLRTPGVTLSRNGGYGTNTSLRIRGAEADQTVVVIDGVKLNDPAAGGRRLQLRQPADGRCVADRGAARAAVDPVGQPGDRRRRQRRHPPA